MKSKLPALRLPDVKQPTQKTVWVSSDGTTFSTQHGAKLREQSLALEELITQLMHRQGMVNEPMTAERVFQLLVRGGSVLIEAVQRYKRAADEDEKEFP